MKKNFSLLILAASSLCLAGCAEGDAEVRKECLCGPSCGCTKNNPHESCSCTPCGCK